MPALSLILLLSCTRDEPVLVGVPATPILQDMPSAADNTSRAEQAGTEPVPYERPDGVYVDIQYLSGRSYSNTRGIVQSQLGELLDTRSLSNERGDELRFSNGTIRVVDDAMYMFEIPLPEPLRRHEALAFVGLPTIADRYTVLNREYRIYHEWDFRRIQFPRLDPDSELVTAVIAWRWLPGEHLQRR